MKLTTLSIAVAAASLASAATGQVNTEAQTSPLDGLKQKTYGSEYHMPYVRVVQARVQGDKPDLVKKRFVSRFGFGDLTKGYMSGMDTVNTASVEGALMFVQAEGINQNARGATERCQRKNNMNYVVLYEILIAQTNETIAQYSSSWNVPEYGPMIPMDGGRCTPLSGSKFPPECLMFNGVNDYPNIGPFVGGGLKNDDVRAPYPDTYWFSFPHTCPLSVWGEKADDGNTCRAQSRKGLCDLGVAPDGVQCTYAYDIIGWVPIDDVVGITSILDANNQPYANFTKWCEASSDHIEFKGSTSTGKMDEGLDFWSDPKNVTRNSERAAKVIEIYQTMLDGSFNSTQVAEEDLTYFKDLPNPDDLATLNPPCYKTVPSCNTGFGCRRLGFSQICFPCSSAQDGCKTDPSFTFPTLARAQTTKKDEELTSGSQLGGVNGATGSITKTTAPPSSTTATPTDDSVAVPMAALSTLVVAAFAAVTAW